MMVGMRFANMDFPVPGGPTISKLFDNDPNTQIIGHERIMKIWFVGL
jgi:hypothetical protein